MHFMGFCFLGGFREVHNSSFMSSLLGLDFYMQACLYSYLPLWGWVKKQKQAPANANSESFWVSFFAWLGRKSVLAIWGATLFEF